MAVSNSRLNSEVCEVVEDKGISSNEMSDKMSQFLGKKGGLSDDDYTRLKRFQTALEKEVVTNSSDQQSITH